MSDYKEQIRERVHELLRQRPDLSGPQIASFTSLAPSTCRHWLAGSNHYSEAVYKHFETVLNQIEAGEILQPGEGPITFLDSPASSRRRVRSKGDFYLTETVKQVSQVLKYCSDNGLIGVITADYGVGKTEAANHWVTTPDGRALDHVMFEFHHFVSAGVCEFMQELAAAIGAPSRKGRMHGSTNFNAVCEHLLANPKLLIFDQCESAQPHVLQAMRQVWDRTRAVGIGMVLLASPLLAEKLHNTRMKDVGALTSRVGVWASLRGLQRAELANIVKQEGIAHIEPDAVDLLMRVTEGSMRRVMAITRLLVEKHGNKMVTARTVEGAARVLWGLHVGSNRSVVSA